MNHEFRVRVLKSIVDHASYRLMLAEMDMAKAEELVGRVRNQARLLLPNEIETYDLIYHSRLSRLVDQFIRSKELAG
jgi:hypothetical protein